MTAKLSCVSYVFAKRMCSQRERERDSEIERQTDRERERERDRETERQRDREREIEREKEREREVERESVCKEPNPTGSRPSDLIGLCRQHTKPHPQHTRKGRGDKETQPRPAERSSGEGGRANRGSAAARPTLTRDWGGPQVRDPVPIVSVNPEAVRERVASELYLKTQPHSLRERARVLYWNS